MQYRAIFIRYSELPELTESSQGTAPLAEVDESEPELDCGKPSNLGGKVSRRAKSSKFVKVNNSSHSLRAIQPVSTSIYELGYSRDL